MLININDLQTLRVKLTFGGRIFKRLYAINYQFNDKECGNITIVKNRKTSYSYFIATTGEKAIKLNAQNITGIEFEIWINDENYEYKRFKRLIFLNLANLNKSEKNEIKYQYNGYAIMVYKNEDFVGRIDPKYNFFTGQTKYTIDFIDSSSVDFLVSRFSIEIIQRYVYKIHETGE